MGEGLDGTGREEEQDDWPNGLALAGWAMKERQSVSVGAVGSDETGWTTGTRTGSDGHTFWVPRSHQVGRSVCLSLG